MKTVTFRLPDELVADLDSEAQRRHMSRTDLVRERLETYSAGTRSAARASFLDLARDLVGSVGDDDRPADLGARHKHYLKAWGYGKKSDR